MLETDTHEFLALRTLTLRLKAAAASQCMEMAFRTLAETVLEDKYGPNQPRAPKGTPEGGQWVVDPASARQRRLAQDRVAELTPFGGLLRQMRLPNGGWLCVYDFGSQKWALFKEPSRQLGCYDMLHQSGVFPVFGGSGTRLNDEWGLDQ